MKYEECTEDILVSGAVVLEDLENMECFRAPEGKSEVRLKVLQNTTAQNGAGQYFATVKDTKKQIQDQEERLDAAEKIHNEFAVGE